MPRPLITTKNPQVMIDDFISSFTSQVALAREIDIGQSSGPILYSHLQRTLRLIKTSQSLTGGVSVISGAISVPVIQQSDLAFVGCKICRAFFLHCSTDMGSDP